MGLAFCPILVQGWAVRCTRSSMPLRWSAYRSQPCALGSDATGLSNPGRSDTGYRLYGDADIAVLRHTRSGGIRLVTQRGVEGSRFQRSASRQCRLDFDEYEPRRSRRTSRPGHSGADLVAVAAALDPFAIGRMLDERFATSSFEQIVESWLLPELDRLGATWADGQVTVAGEHMVAAAIQRRLSAAFDAAGQDGARSPLY